MVAVFPRNFNLGLLTLHVREKCRLEAASSPGEGATGEEGDTSVCRQARARTRQRRRPRKGVPCDKRRCSNAHFARGAFISPRQVAERGETETNGIRPSFLLGYTPGEDEDLLTRALETHFVRRLNDIDKVTRIVVKSNK